MTIDIFSFIDELKKQKIYYDLSSHRDDYIMFMVSVPGERWEIEFSKSGEVEIEIFRSDGSIFSENKLKDLFSNFSD